MAQTDSKIEARDEARRALADRLACTADQDIRVCARDLLVGIPVEPTELRDWADLMDQAASALRAEPVRAAEEMKLRAEIACRDFVDNYRETAEVHLAARDTERAQKAIAWADGAMACGRAIRALPAEQKGGGE